MLTAALPPQPVPVFSGFDYVTIDAQRRRVYAAHGGSKALLIADADSGKVLGQVRVGPMAGSAIDPATGHVDASVSLPAPFFPSALARSPDGALLAVAGDQAAAETAGVGPDARAARFRNQNFYRRG